MILTKIEGQYPVNRASERVKGFQEFLWILFHQAILQSTKLLGIKNVCASFLFIQTRRIYVNSIKKIEGPLPDRKQYRSVLPAQLLMFWENSQEPWGIKDIDSKYIYANRAYYYLLKIDPRKFRIVGHLDNKLPSPISEFASHFQQHDRQTIEH